MAEEKEGIIQVLSPDGRAPHGTGLKLVAQIALAHGGRASFFTENRFRCTLELPVFPQTE